MLGAGSPCGSGPSTEMPRAARSNIATATVAATTATSIAGTRGQRFSSRIDIEHRHGAPDTREHGGEAAARTANDQNLGGRRQQELGGVDIAKQAHAVRLNHGLHAAIDAIEARIV